jgi:hypothetical protein
MKFMPGLIPRKATDRRFLAASLEPPSIYVVPTLIDLRPQLLPSNNQFSSSKCVAFAVAGWLEFYNWKYKGVAAQIDPNPIYAQAKKIDGEPGVLGTTLDAGIQAAQDLELISPLSSDRIRYVSGAAEVQQALHRYGALLGAFAVTDLWGDAKPDGWIPAGGVEIGYHAVLLCGYSTITPPWFALQNSWGDQGWRGFNRLSPQSFEDHFSYGLVIDYMGP